MPKPSRYDVRRFYANDRIATETVRRNLSLADAQAYCNDPETSSKTCTRPSGRRRTATRGPWFCGYVER